MAKHKINTENEVPVIQKDPIMDLNEQKTKWVVTRDGYRVSDKEYNTSHDPEAIDEKNYWDNIAKKHSHGEKVEIVKYENKKHRVW